MTGSAGRSAGSSAARPDRALPAWPSVLAVVAHPDDETFGLGAVIDAMASAGSAVYVLCFTRGEASTLNERGADLAAARAVELRQASTELGVAAVTLRDYPDGGLAAVPGPELEENVLGLAVRHGADGLLVFDDTGITGHPDHRAATAAATGAARQVGLPVLAWTLPAATAARLAAETGAFFAGRPPGEVDIRVRVSRARQRRAALLHVSQISPAAVLWRRLELQGDCEHLRWIGPRGIFGSRPL
jgi:N-acetylglucosamine malate deacetylase 2